MSEKSVLIAFDDDGSVLQVVGSIAEQAEYEAYTTTQPEGFLGRVSELRPGVLVLDPQMSGMDGVEVLRELAEQQVDAGVILLSDMDASGLASVEGYAIAHGLNVIATMKKPLRPEDLRDRLAALRSASAALTPVDLHNAIVNEELVIHYQPKIQRSTDASWDISAMEALLRWPHAQKGMIYPESFVGMAEECGMGRALTDFVIRRGIEESKSWQAAQHGLGLRVNISAGLVADIDFPDRLEATLREHDFDPAGLTLELTETAMLGQDSEVFDIMTRLRVKNVNLAIDDFGIGYSSLTQLFAMPFNEMKIDKSLVAQIPESKEASIMVTALVDLAHKLDLSVCAEGVETEQALNFLASIGCDGAQGFFVSYPVPARDVPSVIDGWSRRNTAGSSLHSAAAG